MSTDLAVTLIALLLALWAVNWARRSATEAERSAIAAEKSYLAAERSATAAKRAAEAAEFSALAAREAAGGGVVPIDAAAKATPAHVDAAVKELIDAWPRDASAWPLVERNPALADGDVEAIIQKAFHLLGRTEAEARHHSTAVLNLRRDQPR